MQPVEALHQRLVAPVFAQELRARGWQRVVLWDCAPPVPRHASLHLLRGLRS